ncbi:MAG: 4-(cytidine 5'-diphospho)-2-C-methyl-D-erythritol kinase, partial [Sulfurimonas sp.]|nr:4-(cytidine 5'-diphospho)-2-C-methyl-D-erythritol kinase [Sulfurimonas sp.]
MKLYKAYAKVNIFLKITGIRGNYHEIISRFMRVRSLYDELSFVAKEVKEFKIIGNFSCTTEQNTIYKAYTALIETLNESETESLKNLMSKYAVHVDKNIPAFAGLGGGSSDAATYLKMCNEVLHLGLSQNELATVGLKVGADVPFFIYGFDSANVGGIGEVVEEFKEPLLD